MDEESTQMQRGMKSEIDSVGRERGRLKFLRVDVSCIES